MKFLKGEKNFLSEKSCELFYTLAQASSSGTCTTIPIGHFPKVVMFTSLVLSSRVDEKHATSCTGHLSDLPHCSPALENFEHVCQWKVALQYILGLISMRPSISMKP